MKVSELIEELQKYPPDSRVEMLRFHGAYSAVDQIETVSFWPAIPGIVGGEENRVWLEESAPDGLD